MTITVERFVTAQAAVWGEVVAELAAGRKRSHWMWFVFPQLKGLGRSGTAVFYGLDGLAEAATYWRHEVLGPRLSQCAALVLRHRDLDAHTIFGSPDDLKLHSCMTLFEVVAPDAPVFADVLEQFYDGRRDSATLRLLG